MRGVSGERGSAGESGARLGTTASLLSLLVRLPAFPHPRHLSLSLSLSLLSLLTR